MIAVVNPGHLVTLKLAVSGFTGWQSADLNIWWGIETWFIFMTFHSEWSVSEVTCKSSQGTWNSATVWKGVKLYISQRNQFFEVWPGFFFQLNAINCLPSADAIHTAFTLCLHWIPCYKCLFSTSDWLFSGLMMPHPCWLFFVTTVAKFHSDSLQKSKHWQQLIISHLLTEILWVLTFSLIWVSFDGICSMTRHKI